MDFGSDRFARYGDAVIAQIPVDFAADREVLVESDEVDAFQHAHR